MVLFLLGHLALRGGGGTFFVCPGQAVFCEISFLFFALGGVTEHHLVLLCLLHLE